MLKWFTERVQLFLDFAEDVISAQRTSRGTRLPSKLWLRCNRYPLNRSSLAAYSMVLWLAKWIALIISIGLVAPASHWTTPPLVKPINLLRAFGSSPLTMPQLSNKCRGRIQLALFPYLLTCTPPLKLSMEPKAPYPSAESESIEVHDRASHVPQGGYVYFRLARAALVFLLFILGEGTNDEHRS